MKVDELFAGANRLWQELSVIILIHAVALILAVLAQVASAGMLTEGLMVSLASLSQLKRLRESLQGVGLDLPFVAGVLGVVYVVLFQRLSSLVAYLPGFRLSYDEASLWRAGKCFDELSQLNRLLAKYTESTTLNNLEATLRLGVTQAAEQYPDNYRELVSKREATAAVWARYYSGFCLVMLASVGLCTVVHYPGRSLLLPVGLLVAALAARCGWEAAIERTAFGRLRFALDCSVVNQESKKIEKEVSDGFAKQRERDWDAAQWPEEHRALVRFAEALEPVERELELAGELVKLPPPFLPFQHLWLLHGLRQLWPFKEAGAFPLAQNELFRVWFRGRVRGAVGKAVRDAKPPVSAEERRLSCLLHPELEPGPPELDDDPLGAPWEDLAVPGPLCWRLDERWARIVAPGSVPDDRVVVRLLRTNAVILLARLLGRRRLLVDRPQAYSKTRQVQAHEARREANLLRQSFRKWAVRVKRRRPRFGGTRLPDEGYPLDEHRR